MAEIEAERKAMTAKRGQIMVYSEALKKQEFVRCFDEALWCGTVEQVRIGKAGQMKFIFKDGTVIEG